MLGHVEGALEGLVQPRAGVPVLERQVVGFLELAENFRLTQHHRIETAGHSEEMFHAVLIGVLVKLVGERVAVVVGADEKFPQRSKSPARLQRGGGVNFHAVAGRENHRLLGQAGGAQGLQRLGDARLGEGELLPHRDGGRMVTQPNDDDVHIRGDGWARAGSNSRT